MTIRWVLSRAVAFPSPMMLNTRLCRRANTSDRAHHWRLSSVRSDCGLSAGGLSTSRAVSSAPGRGELRIQSVAVNWQLPLRVWPMVVARCGRSRRPVRSGARAGVAQGHLYLAEICAKTVVSENCEVAVWSDCASKRDPLRAAKITKCDEHHVNKETSVTSVIKVNFQLMDFCLTGLFGALR